MENKTKTKGLLGIGFSILFVLLGFYLLTQETKFIEINAILVKGLGIACILFFGAVIIYKIKHSLK